MNRSTTAREALLAELLGDVGKLVDRVEAFPATMDKAREEMRDATFLLDSRVEPFQHQMRAAVEQSKTIAINDVRRLTFEIAALSVRQQKEAMTETARTIVREEIGPPMRQLASTLQALIERTRRPQWETWATYAATGTLPTILATCLTVYLMQK